MNRRGREHNQFAESRAAVMRRAGECPGGRPEALLVSPEIDDQVVLGQIFERQNWRLTAVATPDQALRFLRHTAVPLVISERDLPGACWKDLLPALHDSPRPPLLVVMSRLADERLWSEVLNLCGHYVLMKPLCRPEALRVFSHAFHRWSSVPELMRAAGSR